MSAQSNVVNKRNVFIASIIAGLALVAAVAFGSSASAAPGGHKGKPTPSPTVTATPTTSPTPTPTATATVDPSAVLLNCYVDGDYVVADYYSGVVYEGAYLTDGVDLDGNPNVLATYGASNHTKFLKSMLPSGVVVQVNMVAADGSSVASCEVNTGYYNPYN